MANDLTGCPWILDTAGLVKSGRTYTTGFVFRNYTGGGASQAILKDGIRNVTICTLTGNTAGTPSGEAWFTVQSIKNLTLFSIDSGQVEVIIK